MAKPKMTKSAAEQWTMDVPAAGKKYFGLGRDASYAAARRGQIPSIKVGNKVRALVRALEAQLSPTT